MFKNYYLKTFNMNTVSCFEHIESIVNLYPGTMDHAQVTVAIDDTVRSRKDAKYGNFFVVNVLFKIRAQKTEIPPTESEATADL